MNPVAHDVEGEEDADGQVGNRPAAVVVFGDWFASL